MNNFIKHIAKEVRAHTVDYLVLFSAGITFIVTIRTSSGNKMLAFMYFIIFSAGYILWGLFHHYKLRSLHLKNIVEYILIVFILLYLLQNILAN